MNKLEERRIVWQILFWWSAWLLITFSLTDVFVNFERLLFRGGISLTGVIIVVQFNLRYLFPKFLIKKKYFLFILGGVAILGLTVLLLYHENLPWSDWLNGRSPWASDGPRWRSRGSRIRWAGRLTPFIIAFLGSTLVEIARFAALKEKEAIQSEKEKLETELKFLKSQVNPHFLFNALNNIYSLAVMKASQTPDSIMQLSEILRYMVYDANEAKVPLEREITYIENFVELKLLKDSRGMDVQLDLEKPTSSIMIPPLLFIPLVENAFKHSLIENLHGGFIRIKLKINSDYLTFLVSNSIPIHEYSKDEVGGVGLENTKKRLELLYPSMQYALDIHQTRSQFDVTLKIPI